MGYFSRIEHAREGLSELTDEFLDLKKDGVDHPMINEGLKKIGEFHKFLDELYCYYYQNDGEKSELHYRGWEKSIDYQLVDEEVEPFFHNNEES